jgi:hypothetical protein
MKNKMIATVMTLLMFVLPVLASTNFPLTTRVNDGVIAATFPTPDGSGVVAVSVSDGVTNTPDHAAYKQHLFESITSNGNGDFAIAYLDYATLRTETVENLNQGVNGGINAMNMVMVPGSLTSTKFNGAFALEAHAVSDTMESYIIVSISGYRAYMGVVVFDKSLHATEADANEFFATLHMER